MRGWLEDLAHASRRLWRSPGFSITALVILALGIGVNTSAFGLVNALLFQAPPFEDAERVVTVLQDSDGGTPNSTSYPAYLDMREVRGVFESISAFSTDQAFIEQDEALASLLVEYATSGYLDVIGLPPSRGSWFDESADDPLGPPAAVLSHKMWTDRLGADPAVLGSTVRIGGSAVTVIGIGPEAFNGGTALGSIDMWLSISAMRPTGGRFQSLTRRQDHPFAVRARLAPGVTIAQASDAMDVLAADLARTYPELNATRGISVLSVLSNRISPEADARLVPVAAFTMAVVVLVLLIATLNLANLLLVRSTARAREIAVRLALGAGRARVLRVVLSEALVLATVGGALGLTIASGVARTLRNMRFDFGLPISLDVRLDSNVLLFTVVMSAVTGLVFGLLPAMRVSHRDVSISLREDAATTIGARRRFGLTGLLVVGQVAMSLLLLAMASVFLESLVRAQGADPGFATENTAYVQISTRPLETSGEAARLLYQQLEGRLEALPEVGAVALATQLPAAQRGTTTLLLGAALDGVDAPTEIPWNAVSPDYFDVMSVPLLHGRPFEDSDITGPTVALVSAAMARTYWGRTDVVGEMYRSENSPDEPVEVVGVVGDVAVRALGEVPTPSLYWAQGALGTSILVFQAEGDVARAIAAVNSAILDLDPRILLLGSASFREHLGGTLGRQRLVGTLLGAMGGLALLLAVLGVYGVVSFAVSRRRKEVGIRIALGARRDSVVQLFVRDVAAVVVAGSLVGLALAIPAGALIGQLFTGGAGNPLTTVLVASVLVATSLIATVIPALRAARTDPTEALRQE